MHIAFICQLYFSTAGGELVNIKEADIVDAYGEVCSKKWLGILWNRKEYVWIKRPLLRVGIVYSTARAGENIQVIWPGGPRV